MSKTPVFLALFAFVAMTAAQVGPCESFSSAAGDLKEDEDPIVLYFDICTNYCAEGTIFWNWIVAHGNSKGYRTSEWRHVQTSGSWGAAASAAASELAAGKYTNVMVYDLSSSSDSSSSHFVLYNAIGNWFNAVKDRPLILDGRIISTLWTSNRMSGPANQEIVYNFLENLRLRGGGLYLGTDHANNGATGSGCTGVFVTGINEINKNINVGPFCDKYFTHRFAAVDIDNPVMSGPEGPSGWCIEELPPSALVAVRDTSYDRYRRKDPTCPRIKTVVYDHSSTSSAPVGYQPSADRTLYPAAYHYLRECTPSPTNDCIGATAIVSTFRGSVGFLATIESPLCNSEWLPRQEINFTVSVRMGTPPFSYEWVEQIRPGEVELVASTQAWSTSYNNSGVHTFRVVVTDSLGERAEGFAKIFVQALPPTCSDVEVTTTVGTTITGTMTAVQEEDQFINFRLASFPENALFFSERAEDDPVRNAQEFRYEPHPCAEGVESFDFISYTDGGEDRCTITATITGDPAPAGTDDSFAVRQLESYSGELRATSYQATPLAMSFTVVKAPKRGSIVYGSMTQTGNTAVMPFTYTAYDGQGADEIRFEVSDTCKTSETASIAISVTGNSAPVTPERSLSTAVDVPVSANITSYDVEGDTPLVYAPLTDPERGTLEYSATNPDQFTYTPNAGISGRDRFTYTVTDAKGAEAVGVVTISINNMPPTVENLVVQGELGVPVTGQVVGSDPDNSPNPLTFSLVKPPRADKGRLDFPPSGAFTFTPDEGVSGIVSFTFTAYDGRDSSKIGVVTLDIPVAEAVVVPPEDAEAVEKKNNSMVTGAIILSVFAVVVLALAALFTMYNRRQYEDLEDAFATLKNGAGVGNNTLYKGNENAGVNPLYGGEEA